MRPEAQSTVKTEVVLEGVGLHTGCASKISFRSAPPNAGLRFFRADLPGSHSVPARLPFVVATVPGTNLGLGEAKVHTVEHVLSALTGAGVDNADILVWGPEPPIMDGSAMPFVRALLRAGIERFPDEPKRQLRLPREIHYEDGIAKYRAVPDDRFVVRATLRHDHPMLRRQSYELEIDHDSYMAEIAQARTFCFEHEIDFLKSQGLAQGGSLDNAIVIAKDRYLTGEGGLRYPDEFVRHKILDLIGDLTLIGRPLIKMRVEAECLGHAHNIEFAKRLNEAAKALRKNVEEEVS